MPKLNIFYAAFFATSVVALLKIPFAHAQSESIYVDIGPCMIIEDVSGKYACYDLLEAQIRAAKEREAELPVMSIQRNTRNAQQQTAGTSEVSESDDETSGVVEEFGRELPSVTKVTESSARILGNDDGEQELIDTITSLKERLPRQWEVTLASGQVWHQINSKNYRLREGMEVRIYPSPFGGSFRLSATNVNGFIQVRRIQ